jgi:hypothetical protein
MATPSSSPASGFGSSASTPPSFTRPYRLRPAVGVGPNLGGVAAGTPERPKCSVRRPRAPSIRPAAGGLLRRRRKHQRAPDARGLGAGLPQVLDRLPAGGIGRQARRRRPLAASLRRPGSGVPRGADQGRQCCSVTRARHLLLLRRTKCGCKGIRREDLIADDAGDQGSTAKPIRVAQSDSSADPDDPDLPPAALRLPDGASHDGTPF